VVADHQGRGHQSRLRFVFAATPRRNARAKGGHAARRGVRGNAEIRSALRIPTFQFHASNSQPTLAPTAVPARLHICRRQFGLILAFRSVAFHLAGACGRRSGCRRRSGYGRRGGWRGSCGWRSRRGGILVRSAPGQPEQQRDNDLQFKDFPLAPHRQPPPPFRPNVTACPYGRKGARGKLVTFLLTASAGMVRGAVVRRRFGIDHRVRPGGDAVRRMCWIWVFKPLPEIFLARQ
jgi:hypothetical protein